MDSFSTTEPYVYCALADSSYHQYPIKYIRDSYKTNIDKQVVIKDRNSAEGWDYVLFENTEKNSLIVAFRGTDISKQPSDFIVDLFNEIGNATYKPIVIEMSKVVSQWLDKYNNDDQYEEVSFVGHSEGIF